MHSDPAGVPVCRRLLALVPRLALVPGLALALGVASVAGLLWTAGGTRPAVADPTGTGLAGRTAGYAWGYNAGGGLGSGTVARAVRPLPVAMPVDTVRLAAGVGFSLALTKSGAVYSWGDGRWGQLGTGKTATQLTATRISLPGHRRVTAIDAAGDRALAITSDGRVWAWGRNEDGQLGDGTHTDRSTPVAVRLPAGTKIISVAAGTDHTVAVTSTGAVLAWGSNRHGQLGSTPGSDRATPVRVDLPSGTRAAAVSAGSDHSVVLTRGGEVLTFGVPRGVVATGRLRSDPGAARTIDVTGTVIAVDCGAGHTVALTSTGRLYAWGDNSDGQLGDGSRTDRADPVAVRSVGRVVYVAAAGKHVVALDRRGQVWGWGANSYGQVGDSSTTARSTPLRLPTLTGAKITTLVAGDVHTLVAVSRGPAVGLRLAPAQVTVAPDTKQRYTVTAGDAFGHTLGDVTGRARLAIAGGRCRANTCWASTPGTHLVTATVDGRQVTGRLVVTGRAPTTRPTPTPSASDSSPSSRATASPSGPDHSGAHGSHSDSGSDGSGPNISDGTSGLRGLLASTGAAAGLGLAVAVGLACLVLGIAVLIRQRRQRSTSSLPHHESSDPS